MPVQNPSSRHLEVEGRPLPEPGSLEDRPWSQLPTRPPSASMPTIASFILSAGVM
jgi:hypothetical protein